MLSCFEMGPISNRTVACLDRACLSGTMWPYLHLIVRNTGQHLLLWYTLDYQYGIFAGRAPRGFLGCTRGMSKKRFAIWNEFRQVQAGGPE